MMLWIKQLFYAWHNAKVLADMEHRLSLVLDQATAGVLSNSYYAADTMVNAVIDAQNEAYNDAYRTAKDEIKEVITDLLQRLADLENDGMPAGMEPLSDDDGMMITVGMLREIRDALK